MSLKLLVEGARDPYIEASRPAAGDLIWFVHIPKTAGSSFRNDLARHLSPRDTIDLWDSSLVGLRGAHRQRQGVELFIERNADRQIQFGSAHVHTRFLGPVLARPQRVRWITMLRDPVARVLSDYRYARTPTHPAHKEFIEEFPTFEDYIVSPSSQNKMFAFLRAYPREPVEQTVLRILEEFTFVGFTELYQESCSLLGEVLGIDSLGKSVSYVRKTEDRAENLVDDPDRWAEAITSHNQNDVILYRLLRAKLGPVLEAPKAV